VRCAGCHEESFAQWESSAHATSHVGAYKASLSDARKAGAHLEHCATCHEPLAQGDEDHQALPNEGVSCEACHGISQIITADDGAAPQAVFTLAENRKFGPNCDQKDHYFHRMGCGEHVEKSSYCGSCHELTAALGDGSSLAVISEFSDWKASDYAGAMTCQDCHMPWEHKEAAVGTGRNRSRGHHGDRGPGDELTKTALAAELSADSSGDELVVRLKLSNKGAGHALPAGLPSRQLLIEVTALAQDGSPLASTSETLARQLVDAQGAPAPFFAAHHLASDTRLQAGERRKFEFSLVAPGAKRVRVRIADQTLGRELAKRWSLEAPPPRELLQTETKVNPLP
jgi:hypothetical protein